MMWRRGGLGAAAFLWWLRECVMASQKAPSTTACGGGPPPPLKRGRMGDAVVFAASAGFVALCGNESDAMARGAIQKSAGGTPALPGLGAFGQAAHFFDEEERAGSPAVPGLGAFGCALGFI